MPVAMLSEQNPFPITLTLVPAPNRDELKRQIVFVATFVTTGTPVVYSVRVIARLKFRPDAFTKRAATN